MLCGRPPADGHRQDAHATLSKETTFVTITCGFPLAKFLLQRARSTLVLTAIFSMAAFGQAPDKVVTWTASLPAEGLIKPGAKINARLEARILPGWHVYSISQPPGGPTAAVISVPEGQMLRQAGTVTGPLPHSSYDANFEMKTEYYRDSAVFSVPLTPAPSAKAGPQQAIIDVLFQACNDRVCLPPKTAHVPLKFRVAGPSH